MSFKSVTCKLFKDSDRAKTNNNWKYHGKSEQIGAFSSDQIFGFEKGDVTYVNATIMIFIFQGTHPFASSKVKV